MPKSSDIKAEVFYVTWEFVVDGISNLHDRPSPGFLSRGTFITALVVYIVLSLVSSFFVVRVWKLSEKKLYLVVPVVRPATVSYSVQSA